jgi:hypothetical protein
MVSIMAKSRQTDDYSEKEAQQRFEAALKGAMHAPHQPLKEKPKLKPIRIPGSPPGPRRGRPLKGERATTNAERQAKGRAELKSAGARSHTELIRESKLASTTADPKKPNKMPRK